MADTNFTDSSSTTPGTSFVASWFNAINKLVYWGRNPLYAATTGTANAQVLTLPTGSLYSAVTAGDSFTFRAGTLLTNTSTTTLQIVGASALTAGTVKNPDGSNLAAGQITAGGVYTVTAISSTVWILTAGTAVYPISLLQGLGTGVATALAINVGTAGSPVVNGGALGTPSSGILTSATGLPATTGIVAGAANLKLFSNAGATAPEWAAGMKIGTTTRDLTAASGTQAITGVGFKPSLVQFIVAGGSTFVGEASWGVDDGTTAKAIIGNYVAAGTFAFDTGFSISIIESGTASQQAKITTLGADGFTLTWTKTGSPSASTAQIIYICFR